MLMFGATCPKCQKMLPALKAAADAINEQEESVGAQLTKVGAVGLEDSPKTYELFWIEKMPSFKLLHPRLNLMYDYVGDSENGGLCCFDNDACGGDTDLFERCLTPLDKNLRQFVLNDLHDHSACRSTEKDIPKLKTIWDNFLLAAPRVLWKHLVKAHGFPIVFGASFAVVGMCAVVCYMALGPSPVKKSRKTK